MLEILGNYLINCMDKEEKKNKQILTENRLITINKRETSFEGLVSQLENGEDGIFNLINDNKNTILQPKIFISQKDLKDIPELKTLKDSIEIWEEKLKTATGKEAFIIKKNLIEMRKDQYVIKNSFKQPIGITKNVRNNFYTKLDEEISFDDEGYCVPSGVSLLDPKVCSAVLCNYVQLKESANGKFNSDLWYLLQDFEKIYKLAMRDFPFYKRIAECKMRGLQNHQIQQVLQIEFKATHSLEYISSLWRNKIPNLIASKAEDEYLSYYYLSIKKGKYKKCSRCGKIKLAHNKYFSKNKTSKDGFYSICKECRNAKNKEKK